MLPADYVTEHVELAYASTAYGVQGDTVPAAHVVIGDQTGAASAYVGMTRGQLSNTAHLVAADVTEARAQWIAVFGRDRADLGPGHAAELAAREATRDRTAAAPPRPVAPVPSVPPGPRRSGGDHPSPVEAPRRASVDEAASTGRPRARTPATGGELEELGSHRWSAVTNRAEMAPSPVTEHSPPEPTGASHVPPSRQPRTRTAHHHRGRRTPPLPVATLRYWRHRGTGPRSFRLGRRVLYRADDLHSWIDAQHGRVAPAPDARP